MDQPFYAPPDLNLEVKLLSRDNLKVQQLDLLLDFLRQICFVDVNSNPPFIKLDICEDEVKFG